MLNYRYIARIKVEATTPLFMGSGNASLLTDSLVFKDHFGLPMIPGTSIAGVLRHSVEDFSNNKEKWEDIFGYAGGDDNGKGSRIIVSSAYFLTNKNKTIENLDAKLDEELLSKLNRLPVRQHVKITHKGVAEKGNLFDHEVLHKGARFIFEIELKGTKEDEKDWKKLIENIKNPTFRLGQGTRNGYGNLKVTELFEKTYNLKEDKSFEDYLNFNPSFNADIDFKEINTETQTPDYTLELEPDDFFIFSEGFGDQDVDNKPVTEEVMEYSNDKIDFKLKTLIPATSIKGAIAHRVGYHYNRLNGFYVDEINNNLIKYLDSNNKAVATLFGVKCEIKDNENIGQRGIVIMDDLYCDDIDNSKIFNHVAIDRFTSGGIDGALFSEKVSYKKDKKITLKIYLARTVEDVTIQEALEATLIDICRGLLPLGGMTTKGFGMFTGKLYKQTEEIFNYKLTKTEV